MFLVVISIRGLRRTPIIVFTMALFLLAQAYPTKADFLTPENHPYRIAVPSDPKCKILADKPEGKSMGIADEI